MTTNQERALEVMWAANDGFTEGDVSRMAQALADAGLLAGEYIELAPKNRLGIGGAKDHVIISDNLTRTTIKVSNDDADGLMTALLLVKAHQENASGH